MAIDPNDPQIQFHLSTAERDRRRKAAVDIMNRHEVDAVIAYSDFGDQAGLQRYLSNFRSAYDYQAVVFFKDDCEIVMTHPGALVFSKQISWASESFPMAFPESIADTKDQYDNILKVMTVGGQLANRLNEREVKRIGVINYEYFPTGWANTIKAAVPGVEFVDVWDDFNMLRLVKGPEEQKLIREAARISNEIWKKMPEIVQRGRRRYEVLADIEHIIGSNGCEDSFNLCMELPLLEKPMDRYPYSAQRIDDNSTYLIEVSPRFMGYYAQQTGIVATGPIPSEMRKAYDAVNRAREKGLQAMKPGVDLVEIGSIIDAQFKSDGYQSASPSFGHAIGLELEDQHITGRSLVLEEGMTFIFHPFAAGHPAVMRADTYLITASGVECLTLEDLEPMQV